MGMNDQISGPPCPWQHWLSALDVALGASTGVATFEAAMIDEAMRRGAMRTLASTGDPL